MSRLEIILIAISSLSILFNFFIGSYCRRLIVEYVNISEELGDFKEMTDSFLSHLKSVYNLETFYGDDTLKALMDHAQSYNEYLSTFEYVYSITEVPMEDDEETNSDTEEEK
jgi:hypothetical protein